MTAPTALYHVKPAARLVASTCALAIATLLIALAEPADAYHTRFIDVKGSITVVDDVWPWRDEKKTYSFSGWVDLTGPSQWIRVVDEKNFCAGKEVRVHLIVWIRMVPGGGVRSYPTARLYEGAEAKGCNTTEWNGTALGRPITTFGEGSHYHRNFRVRNDQEGGDYATAWICVEHDSWPWIQGCPPPRT